MDEYLGFPKLTEFILGFYYTLDENKFSGQLKMI